MAKKRKKAAKKKVAKKRKKAKKKKKAKRKKKKRQRNNLVKTLIVLYAIGCGRLSAKTDSSGRNASPSNATSYAKMEGSAMRVELSILFASSPEYGLTTTAPQLHGYISSTAFLQPAHNFLYCLLKVQLISRQVSVSLVVKKWIISIIRTVNCLLKAQMLKR